MWKVRHLKPPPACSLRVSLDWEQSKIIQEAFRAICKAEESVQNHSILWTENFLLESLIYKLKNQFRADKSFQGLKKIRSCLKRFKEIELEKLLSEIKQGLQIDPEMQEIRLEHLPSQQCLQYILVRLMSTTALMTQMVNYCVYTFLVICKSLRACVENLYDKLTSCLPVLAKTEFSWLPVGEELPQDLATWLTQTIPSHDMEQQDLTRQMQKIVEQRSKDAYKGEQKMTHNESRNSSPFTGPEKSSVNALEDIGEPICRGKLEQRRKKRKITTTTDNYSTQICTPLSYPSARENTETVDADDEHLIEEQVTNDSPTYDEELMIATDTSLQFANDRKQVKAPLEVDNIFDKINHSKKVDNFLAILRKLKTCLDKYHISIEQFKKCRNKIKIYKRKTTQYLQRRKEYLELGRKCMTALFHGQNCVELSKGTFSNSCGGEYQLENALKMGGKKTPSTVINYDDTIEESSRTEPSSVKRPKGKKTAKLEKCGHGGNILCGKSDVVQNQNQERKRLVESLEVTDLKNVYRELKVNQNDDISLQNFHFSLSKAERMRFKKKIGFYCKKLKAVKAGKDEEFSVIMTKAKKYVNKFLNTKSFLITGLSDSMQSTTKQPAQEILLSNTMTVSQSEKIEKKQTYSKKKKQKQKLLRGKKLK